jgi:hypothetical protein
MKIALPFAFAMTLMGSAAMAQTTTTTPPPAPAPSTSPALTAPNARSGMTMTDQQVNTWINKTVYSSDGKNVGEVAEIRRDSSGKVSELRADIGGFLGLGETRVTVMPSQFAFGDDRVVLNLTAEQVKALPKVAK